MKDEEKTKALDMKIIPWNDQVRMAASTEVRPKDLGDTLGKVRQIEVFRQATVTKEKSSMEEILYPQAYLMGAEIV